MGYDKDTVSKDDFMGKISLSTSDITKLKQGQWIPLQGIKSGEIFIECDIITDVNVSAIVDDKEANNFARQPAGISGLSKDSETVGSVIHKSETLEEEAQSKNLEGMKKTDTIDSSMRKTEDVSAADVQTRTADGAENKTSISDSISQHSEMKGKDSLSTERTLKLTVISARKLKKSGLFGKADPYVALTYGSHKTKSSVVKNNLNPEWNFDNLLTIIEKASDEVLLEVYDKDTGSKDDFMGRVSLPISELTTLKQGQWIPLQKTKSGEICLSCVFVSETSGDRDAFERVESVEELEIATLTGVETKKVGGIRAVKELLSAEKKPRDDFEHAESFPNGADTPQSVASEPEVRAEDVKNELHLTDESEAKLKAEGDAEKAKLEEESRQKAEAEALKSKQEEEARLRAEEEAARATLEGEARLISEAEAAKQEEEEEARLKAEAEKAKQAEEARLRAEAEAAEAKQEEEIKQKAEAEKAKQMEEERLKAEAEAANAKQEEEIKQKAEAEKQKAEAEAARAKQEEETKQKAKAEKARL